MSVGIEMSSLAIIATQIGHEHPGTCVIVMSPAVVGIDTEVPCSGSPFNGTIEVVQTHKSVILPVSEHIPQVCVATAPPCAKYIPMAIKAHQIVEVYLIY